MCFYWLKEIVSASFGQLLGHLLIKMEFWQARFPYFFLLYMNWQLNVFFSKNRNDDPSVSGKFEGYLEACSADLTNLADLGLGFVFHVTMQLPRAQSSHRITTLVFSVGKAPCLDCSNPYVSKSFCFSLCVSCDSLFFPLFPCIKASFSFGFLDLL